MITKTFKLLILVALFSAVSLSAQAVLAQTWQGPPAGTPPVCDANHLGCFSPINVSSAPQIKSGNLGILGRLNLTTNGVLEFASNLGAPDKETNAGKMAYKKWGRQNGLDIVGAGTAIGNRLVNIWDNLNVVGTTTTTNMYANNYFVCSGAGNCSPLTINGGDSSWSLNALNKNLSNTNTGEVIVGGASTLTTRFRALGVSIFDSIGVKGGTSVFGDGAQLNFNSPKNLAYGSVYSSADSLSLIGIGNSPNRKVTILDSIFTRNICTVAGSCISIGDIINNITNPVAGYWTKVTGENEIITPSAVGIAGATNPSSGLSLAVGNNNTGIKVDSSTGLMSIFNGISRLTISSTGIISVPETKSVMYGTGSVAGSAASLDIKGVGVAGSRIVTVYDTLRTSNICTIDGSVCNSVTNIINNASSPWKLNGSNVYYTGGKVGVGLNNPVTELQVKGTVTSDNFLSRGKILVLDTSGDGGFLQSSGGSLDITGAGTGKYVTLKNNLSVANNLIVNNQIGVGGAASPNSNIDIAVGSNLNGISAGDVYGDKKGLNFWTSGVKRLILDNSGNIASQKSMVATNIVAWPVQAGDTGWLNRDQFIYDNVFNSKGGAVVAKEVCIGDPRVSGNCKSAWPTSAATYPTVIYCVFSPAGLITGSGCGWTGIDGWDGDNIAEDEAVMHCPASYKATGGGVVCGKVGNMNRVEGTYQWDEDSWYVNCQSDLEIATISCIKTSN